MSEFKNKIVNAKDKVAGEVKEAVGKATKNEELELKGKLQSTKADVKGKIDSTGKKIAGDINDLLDNKKR